MSRAQEHDTALAEEEEGNTLLARPHSLPQTVWSTEIPLKRFFFCYKEQLHCPIFRRNDKILIGIALILPESG